MFARRRFNRVTLWNKEQDVTTSPESQVQTQELREIVERVRAATAGLSGDDFRLRELAFKTLLEHELQQRGRQNGAAEDDGAVGSEGRIVWDFSKLADRAAAVGRYFEIWPDEALQLFDLSERRPALRVAADALSAAPEAALQEIALLLTGARTALGLDTGMNDIRAEAARYRCLPPDFVDRLSNYDLIGVSTKRGSVDRIVRLKVIGSDQAEILAQRLAVHGS